MFDKKRIRRVTAALLAACLLVLLGGNAVQHSLTWQRNLQFARHQWLADARTVVSVIHYLYESETGWRGEREAAQAGLPSTNSLSMAPAARKAADLEGA